MTPFGMSGSVQVSVIVVSVGSAVNPVGGEEAIEREITCGFHNIASYARQK